MSTEDNKALGRRFIEELFHRKNLAAIDELCTPDVVIHSPIRTVEGVQAYKQFLSVLLAGFSNMQVTIEDQFAAGDRSALRYAEQGTYTGDVRGISVTARPFQTTGIMIMRHAADGKIVEAWDSPDTLGLMQQLGVIAAPGPAN
jgi:predicted ester cyclase